MNMSGRYTLSGGSIRYSIPVIPLTDFTIQDGSYVEWQGDLMNPYLNLTALTRQRANVNLDGRSQIVDFNVGLQVRQQLRNIAASRPSASSSRVSIWPRAALATSIWMWEQPSAASCNARSITCSAAWAATSPSRLT